LVDCASDVFVALRRVVTTQAGEPPAPAGTTSNGDSPFAPLFHATNQQLTSIRHLDPAAVDHDTAVFLLSTLLLATRDNVVPLARPPDAGHPPAAAARPPRPHHHSFRLDHQQRGLARALSSDSLRGASPQPSPSINHHSSGGSGAQISADVPDIPAPVAASPFLGGIAASFRRVKFASGGDYSHIGSPASVGIATPEPVQEFERLVREPSENPNAYYNADDDDDVVGSSINGWLLIGDLGRGSYGQVMLACHSETDDIAAIKIVHRSIFNRERRRALLPRGSSSNLHGGASGNSSPKKQSTPPTQGIRREIAVMKRLQHRHLVKLKAVIDDPQADRLYLVMQYVPHGPFLPRRKEFTSFHRTDPLPEPKARRYARQLISALRHLHSNNIVHRDVKPENILRGDNDTLFLADFGVSEIVDDLEVTRNVTGTHGTPAFWPPELFKEESGAIDGIKQDEWAFAVTVYLMLVGRLPFEGSSLSELGESIMHDRVIVPDDLSHVARDFLRKALDRDPGVRLSLSQMRRHPFIVGPKTSRVRDKLQSRIEAAPRDQSPVQVPTLAPNGVVTTASASGSPKAVMMNADGTPYDARASLTPNPPPALKPASSAAKTDPTTGAPLRTSGSSYDSNDRDRMLPGEPTDADNAAADAAAAASAGAWNEHTTDDEGHPQQASSSSAHSKRGSSPLGRVDTAEAEDLHEQSVVIEQARVERGKGQAHGIGRAARGTMLGHGSSGTLTRGHGTHSPLSVASNSHTRFPGVDITESSAATPQPGAEMTIELPATNSPGLLVQHVQPEPAGADGSTESLPEPYHGDDNATPVGPNFSRLAAIAMEQGGLLTPNHTRAAAQVAMFHGAFEVVSPNARARREVSKSYTAFGDDDDAFEDSFSDFATSSHPAGSSSGPNSSDLGPDQSSNPLGSPFEPATPPRRIRRASTQQANTLASARDGPTSGRRDNLQQQQVPNGSNPSSRASPNNTRQNGSPTQIPSANSAAFLTRTGSYSVGRVSGTPGASASNSATLAPRGQTRRVRSSS